MDKEKVRKLITATTEFVKRQSMDGAEPGPVITAILLVALQDVSAEEMQNILLDNG